MSTRFDHFLDRELIRNKRQEDPVLNEVCLDFQALKEELESLAGSDSLGAVSLVKDLKATLAALEKEILERVAL